MKKIIAFLFFLVLCFRTNATTKDFLDSIKTVLLKTTSKTEKLYCLYTLSFEYGLIEPRKGITYGKECLELARKENNLLYQLNGFNGIANAYETLANFDSAKYFHSKSYEIAKKMEEPPRMALTLFNVALCYKQLGDYKNALNQYLTAYKLLEHEKSYNPRIHFYIGEIYIRMGDYQQAEFHSRLGKKKCKEFNHDYIAYNMDVNLAKCLYHNGKLDSAIFLLENALNGLKTNTDQYSLAACHNAFGEVYLIKKDFDKAFQHFSEELNLQQSLKNDNGIKLAFINLAHTAALKNTGNFSLAKNFLQQSENNFSSIKKNSDILLELYYKTGATYELINNPQKALSYYKLYFALKDSLLNTEKQQQVLELQARYETEKKEQEIESLKQNDLIKSLEIQSKNDGIKKRNIFIGFGLVLFILIGFLVYFFVQKQKLRSSFEKELAVKSTEEKERLRMAKDIHDDLGSGLSKINFLSELIIRNKNLSSETEESAHAIAETSKKLVVNMRDLIWALDPENVTLSGLVARIREYSTDYLEDFSAELQLKTLGNIPEASITKESHREILMTVKESLNNIVKHSKATFVEIEAGIVNEFFSISVKDNGVGIIVSGRSGNGLKNMKTRIESVGGEFLMSSNEAGTLIKVTVPVRNILNS